jgi:hypothetical protein
MRVFHQQVIMHTPWHFPNTLARYDEKLAASRRPLPILESVPQRQPHPSVSHDLYYIPCSLTRVFIKLDIPLALSTVVDHGARKYCPWGLAMALSFLLTGEHQIPRPDLRTTKIRLSRIPVPWLGCTSGWGRAQTSLKGGHT